MGPRWRMLVLVLVYFIYLFLGATVFSAIEHPIERKMLKDLEEQKAEFLGKNKCIKGQNFKNTIYLLNPGWLSVFLNRNPLRPTHG